MGVKVIFIGNPIAGDDGIGPCLYNELKREKQLDRYEMMELGVMGLDLISYVEDNDELIIVDAIHSDKNIGKVVVLGMKDLLKKPLVVSQHDFGIEQTIEVLRRFKSGIKTTVIGINVRQTKSFTNNLSEEIMKKMPKIREEVMAKIIGAAK